MTENCDAVNIAYCEDDDMWREDKQQMPWKAMRGAKTRLSSDILIPLFTE